MDYNGYRLFAHKTHWITAVAVTVLAFAISVGFAIGVGDGDSDVRIVWPSRLSKSVDADLVVVASFYDDGSRRARVGADVRLFQIDRERNDWDEGYHYAASGEGLRELSASMTDESGRATLRLPAVKSVAQGQHGVKGELTIQPEERPELVLRVETNGEVMWFSHPYDKPPQASIAMSADRPLYQPGQEIQVRLLAVDPDTTAPVSGSVDWAFRDPRGNLVFRKTTPVSKSGTAHTAMKLSPDCIQGSWSLSATFDNVSISKTVEVQPFQLPRFKVVVQPARPQVKSGEEVSGAVVATYTYGDAVADADVELTASFGRPEGVPGTETLQGKTDKDGRLAFSLALAGASGWGTVSMSAVVTNAAGRTERGTGSVAFTSRQIQVDLLAAGTGDAWVANVTNDGFVVVSESTGEPVANATIELVVPEEKEERVLNLRTDDKGRAPFSWIPTHRANQIRLEVSAPDGRTWKRRMDLRIQGGLTVVELDSPRAVVGEPIGLQVRYMRSAGLLIAFNRDYPVGSLTVSPGQDGQARLSLVLDARSRGLTELRLYGAEGEQLTTLPIWVSQRGGDTVEMTLDQPTYAPGSSAALALAFPPTADDAKAPAEAPVNFGVIGVDEALYALKERTDAPLSIVLRHDPGMVGAAAAALEAAPREQDADPTAMRISSARFVRVMHGQLGDRMWGASYGYGYGSFGGSNITREVREVQRLPFIEGWTVLLALGFLGLGYVGIRATWRPLSKGDFSVGRVFALIGIIVAGITVAAFPLAAREPGFLFGGLTVWLIVVVCWLIASAVRRPNLSLSLWLWVVLGLMLLAVVTILAWSDGGYAARPSAWVPWVLVVAIGIPVVLFLVELLLWSVMLVARKLYQPGFGLVSFLGFALASTLLSVFAMRGSDFAPASKSMPMSIEMPSPTGGAAMPELMVEEEKARDDAPAARAPSGRRERADAPPPPGGDPSAGPRVRSFFPETMVWAPEVSSDATGRATLKIDVPDSITTWRLNAMANTWDGRLGEGQTGMRVWQPFFVELDLPTHLTRGDSLQVPVSIINNGDTAVVASLAILGESGLSVGDGLPTSVEVPGKDRKVLTIPLLVTGVGRGSLTVTATVPDGAGDAVKREATLAPDGRWRSISESGIISEGWGAPVTPPQDAIAGTTEARVNIYPSVVADALDGLDSMLRRPSGCFEQASSATYPNVMVVHALNTTPKDKWPGGPEQWERAHDEAIELLALGYQKMLSYQSATGGFGLYPNTETQIMLSAYGLMQLTAMNEVYPIDMEVMRRLTRYLVSIQNQSGSWPVYAGAISGGSGHGHDPGQVRSTAFVAWAILSSPVAEQYKYATDRALDHMLTKLDAADAPDTVALAANALLAAGRKDAANAALDRLVGMADRKGDVVYWPNRTPTWMGGWGTYADIETTALATYALLVAEKHPELLSGSLRYLAAQRSFYGGWGTTQATVWTLKTMQKLRSLGDQPVTLSLKLDGQLLKQDNPGGADQAGTVRLTPDDLLMRSFHPDGPVQAGERRFTVEASTKTAAMVQATLRYAVPWTSPNARVPGERLTMRVSTDQTIVRRGGALIVHVDVTNPVADDYGATIVELPRPPAAWVEPDQFELLQANGVIDRFEVLPTHVRLYLSGMGKEQVRSFQYEVRPLLAGRVSLPPGRAYLFYVPEPITEVDGGELVVE